MSNCDKRVIVRYQNVISIMQSMSWLPIFGIDTHNDGVVFTLLDYENGDGEKPTDYIGWYMGDGEWVENIGDALVFGQKGDDFTFDDFTPEQILLLQKPAIDAASNANSAAQSANEAAIVANNARGWQAIEAIESYGNKDLRYILDWQGGTGEKPTTNVGLYFKVGGGFTSDKDLAVNFRGKDGYSIVNINPNSSTSQIRMWEGTIAQYNAQKPLPTDVMVFITDNND